MSSTSSFPVLLLIAGLADTSPGHFLLSSPSVRHGALFLSSCVKHAVQSVACGGFHVYSNSVFDSSPLVVHSPSFRSLCEWAHPLPLVSTGRQTDSKRRWKKPGTKTEKESAKQNIHVHTNSLYLCALIRSFDIYWSSS